MSVGEDISASILEYRSSTSDVKPSTAPRWLLVIIIECWLYANTYWFPSFGLEGFAMTHVWALFHTAAALYVKKYFSEVPAWTMLISGAPRWQYLFVLLNDFIILPSLLAMSLWNTPCLKTWILGVYDLSTDKYAANVFYCLMGGLLKDIYIQKSHEMDLFGMGLYAHHLIAISACSASLCFSLGGGIATFNAVMAEVGSGCFNLHILKNTARTITIYMTIMTATNIIGMIAACVASLESKRVFKDSPIFGFPEAYVLLCAFLLALRQYSCGSLLYKEYHAMKKDPEKAVLSKTFLGPLLVQ